MKTQAESNDLIGKEVMVYSRYMFAVPVVGVIKNVSEKDGAFQVVFYGNNPGGTNVTRHSGSYFHWQQCRINGNMIEPLQPKKPKTVNVQAYKDATGEIRFFEVMAGGDYRKWIKENDWTRFPSLDQKDVEVEK